MNCRAAGHLPGAIEELEALLVETGAMSAPQRAYLLQAMGLLHAATGQIVHARQCFLQAEGEDPESLLVLLGSARFLGETLGDWGAAVAKCDELIAIAMRRPFGETEGDYSSAEYIERATVLKARFVADGEGQDSTGP